MLPMCPGLSVTHVPGCTVAQERESRRGSQRGDAPRSTSHVLPDGRDPGYGYGIGVWELDGHRALSHSGRQSKANAFLLLCPDDQLGVAIMSNSSNFETVRLARTLMRILRQR